MQNKSSLPPWFDGFLGVAYRYYDLRMNVAPLFSERKQAASLWNETIHWWSDHNIKLRFVETGEKYWFIMGSDSKKPENNKSLFKILPKSEHYERFKNGHGGEAYLTLGVYAIVHKKDAKDDTVCNCGHRLDDHEEGDSDACLVEECSCRKFDSFQVNLLKRKKTITDIKFLQEAQVKEDPLTWNCLYANKYKEMN
ncbi:MAG: hypothetical protein AABW74_01995 [Thermoproteota archaeon]